MSDGVYKVCSSLEELYRNARQFCVIIVSKIPEVGRMNALYRCDNNFYFYHYGEWIMLGAIDPVEEAAHRGQKAEKRLSKNDKLKFVERGRELERLIEKVFPVGSIVPFRDGISKEELPSNMKWEHAFGSYWRRIE